MMYHKTHCWMMLLLLVSASASVFGDQRTFGPASLEVQDTVSAVSEEAETLVRVVERLIARQDYQRAIEIIQGASSKSDTARSTLAQLRYLRAKAEIDQGNYPQAAVWLNSWLESFSEMHDVPKIMFILGQTYRKMGAHERARDAFYKTLTYSLAKATVAAGRDEEGIQLGMKMGLTRAAMWELAETEYTLLNWQRAHDLYGRFIDQNIDAAALVETAIYRQADCLFQLHDTEGSIEDYRTALAVAPMHPFATEAWVRLTGLYALSKRVEDHQLAMQSFIWCVDNLEADKTVYWQQRYTTMMADLFNNDRPLLKELLAGIPPDASDKGWGKVRSQIEELLSRGTEPSITAASNEQDWSRWRQEFEKRQKSLEARSSEALRYLPPSGKPQM